MILLCAYYFNTMILFFVIKNIKKKSHKDLVCYITCFHVIAKVQYLNLFTYLSLTKYFDIHKGVSISSQKNMQEFHILPQSIKTKRILGQNATKYKIK